MKLYQSLRDRLESQHEAIGSIIDGVDDRRLAAQLDPGKWSIHDNITHLAKYQPIFVERVNAIIHLKDPVFNAYRAEYDPDFETWRQWSTAKLLDALAKDRREIFDLVTGLSQDEISRVGVHKKWGKLDVVEWTEFFILHEAHHIRTIFQLVHTT